MRRDHVLDTFGKEYRTLWNTESSQVSGDCVVTKVAEAKKEKSAARNQVR